MKPETVNIGFLPLVDCALLVIAREKGFAKAHGIDLCLYKEVSWANIRDKVYLGYLDGAHMLAPMVLAANLSLMPNSTTLLAPFVLGRNGNAITLSRSLFDEMQVLCPSVLDDLDLAKTGALLRQIVERRQKEGAPMLRFGMVFPFSCHNYHLRYWLAACGIDPDLDVQLDVVPPPFMGQVLQEGRIDGFCVGEPWNSLAVAQGIGVIVASTSQIWPHSPEKLLGIRQAWAKSHPDVLSSLMKALQEAAQWIGQAGNQQELAHLLAEEKYLNVPDDIIMRALGGELLLIKEGTPCEIENFLSLSHDPYPYMSEASWLFEQMKRWGQVEDGQLNTALLEKVFARDLYSQSLGVDLPEDREVKLFDIA